MTPSRGRPVGGTLIHDLVGLRAEAHGSAPAFTTGGTTLSFAGWAAASRTAAARLRARGVRPGDHVLLVFEDAAWPAFAPCFTGVLAAGGVAVPVRRPTTPDRLRALAAAVRATGVITDAPGEVAAPEPGWTVAAERLLAPGADAVPPPSGRSAADAAAVVFTSGTTGRPRAIVCAHKEFRLDPRTRALPEAPRRAALTSVAIGTNAALEVLSSCLHNGVHTVVLNPFRPAEVPELVEAHDVVALSLVPTTARLVAAELRAAGRTLPRVRSVVCSSAPLDEATVELLAAAFPGATLRNTYTVAEGGPSLTSECRPGAWPALGRIGGRVRVVDEHGVDVAPGSVGELLVHRTRSRNVLGAGPARGGWRPTGDLCLLGADGSVYYVDRADDRIVMGGLTLHPVEIESALRGHPGVRDAAVFGVPHPVLGQIPVAAVTLAAGTSPGDVRDHCAAVLPPEQVPRDLMVVAELPVTPNGKVRKERLRADYEAAPAAPAASAPATRNETLVAEVFREVLDVGPLDRDAGFFGLGGHSLLAVAVAEELTARLGRAVEPALVVRHPRVADLALRLPPPAEG
ncbi:AMP-binding protein [Spirillospora sp. NPDC050679]